MFVNFLVAVLAVLAVLSRAEDAPGMKAGGASWKQGGMQKVTSLLGVYSTSDAEVYGAVLDNALGNGLLYSDDSAASGQFFGPAGAMNMDVSFTKDGKVGILGGVGGIFVGPAKSADYKKVSGMHSITQNVETFGTQGLAAAGEFTYNKAAVNGLAVSPDAGVTWQLFDVKLNSTTFPARYASLPSENTWYVSAGAWPYDEVSSTLKQRLSAKLSVHKNGMVFADRIVSEDSGYTGAIARTTDGGKTWSQVFDSKGGFYMNAISCADETHCVAVGENDAQAFVVATSDGVNWDKVLSSDAGISLIAARMISPTEAWVAGGGQVNRQLTGYYYHTVDGGSTWELSTLPGYVMDLTFTSSDKGYAAYLTQSYGSVAVYN